MNLSVLVKILTSDYSYWVLRKSNGTQRLNAELFKPSIIMCVIPSEIKQGLKREEIKLTDLERLQSVNYQNIFLNEDYPPFQAGQNFYDITEAYPIPCNQKEFLIKALNLESDDIWDYKKLIDELCSDGV